MATKIYIIAPRTIDINQCCTIFSEFGTIRDASMQGRSKGKCGNVIKDNLTQETNGDDRSFRCREFSFSAKLQYWSASEFRHPNEVRHLP